MVSKDTILLDTLFYIKKDLLDNLTDPLAARSASSKFVMTSYPQRPVNYPLITIKAINL